MRIAKKLLGVVLSACLILSLLPMTALAVVPPSGSGWAIDENGQLTIGTSSGMYDWWSQSSTTHSDYKALVKSVVILDDGVTDASDVIAINGYAFSSCTNLTSVTIPATVEEIGDGAFATCTSLKSITLPATVQSIGSGAFFGCTSLTSVIFPGTTPPGTVGASAFDATAKLYVPAASLAAYKTSALSAYASSIYAIPAAITKGGTTTYYASLSDALEKAADNDTIALLADITEEASNAKATDGITVTIDGGNHTVTGSDPTNSVALTLIGTDTVILKNLTLQGGAASSTSIGLKVGDPVSVQSYGSVTVMGGAASRSYGLENFTEGTVDVTAASATGTNMGVGVANSGLGTVNVGTAEGGGAQGIGAANTSTGTINVATAEGSMCGVNNQSTGTVNVTTATGIYFGVYNVSTGTINATTITSSDIAVTNDSNGKVNAGTISSGTFTTTTNMDVAAVALNIGTGASCVLDAITVSAQDYTFTTIGTLPSVYKDGEYSNAWYSDSEKTQPFRNTSVPGSTTLYSDFYESDVTLNTAAISGVTAPVRGATPVTSLAETSEYTAAIAWSPTVSGAFTASTVYTATITLTPKTGYTTTGVTANFFTVSGAAATNSTDSSVITAVFPATAAAPSNDSSPSGGGGTTTTTPTTTVSGSTATTTVTPTVSGGVATGSVTADQMSDAVKKAQAAAGTNGKPAVIIQIGGATGASSVGTTIPHASMQALASVGGALTISGPTGSVSFDAAALKTISGASGDVTVTVAKTDSATLSAAAKALVGSHPVFTLSVTGGGSAISQFGGDVTVSVPYAPAKGEDTNAIVIYYIAADGTPTPVPDARYDAATGTVIFTTMHFSIYAVGYNKVSFTDVSATAWYADAVTFLSARGVTSGTTASTFSPNATLTRGQFITMLLRAYGVSAETNPTDNFTDAGSTYYTGYLAAAKKLGITSGVGENKFAPDNAITRQEMFTLLYNALKVLDKLPSGATGKTLSSFTDSGSIASWATDAMTALVKAGTVAGSNGALKPNGITTRAEMAQVLYNLLGK